MDDLSKAARDFASLMEAIENREGVLRALLEEGGSGQQAIRELRDAVASLNRTASRLESSDNLMGRLLSDREYSARLAEDLEATLARLRSIVEKIDEGEGSLGALLNERAMHDGLEDIVTGVNDSKFARWLLRHYQKKGIKARTQEEKTGKRSGAEATTP